MGLCGSAQAMSEEEVKRLKAQAAVTKQVEADMLKDQTAQNAFHKLLLLGAGESGKSTLFKQMTTLYGKGWPESERRKYTTVVHGNLVTCMRRLVEQSATHGIITGLAGEKKFVEDMKGNEGVDGKTAEVFAALWRSEGIQLTYAARTKFQLLDSCAYFMGRCAALGAPDYIPTEQDVLRSRAATSGIVENEFTINGEKFKMFDVGGQRNERKKWIHCFESVTALIFVASLSEYDEMLYEDDQTNRMDESLRLFAEIVNSKWFMRTSVLLFLNKRDLFAEKLGRVPLSKFFPGYEHKGADTPEARLASGSAFLKAEFESKNKSPGKKLIYTHVTCATDTEHVRAVFHAVKDIINKQAMDDAGFLT